MSDAAQAVQEVKHHCSKCAQDIKIYVEEYISIAKSMPGTGLTQLPQMLFHLTCFQDAAGDEYVNVLREEGKRLHEQKKKRDEETAKRTALENAMKAQAKPVEDEYKTYIQGTYRRREYPPTLEEELQYRLRQLEQRVKEQEYRTAGRRYDYDPGPIGPIPIPKDFLK